MLQGQFHLYDADGDDIVNEAESKLILDSIIQTQKAVVTEIFATHVSSCLQLDHATVFSCMLLTKSTLATTRCIICPRNTRNMLLRAW